MNWIVPQHLLYLVPSDMSFTVFKGSQGAQLESIQGTCRLSLKMGRGDEQKPLMHCIRQ